MKKNSENNYTNEKEVNDEILNNIIEENNKKLNWDKVLPLARYAGEAPPIILDNVIDEENIKINASAVLHKGPSNHMRVLTCYLDKTSGRWIEARRASHPFISVNVTKINPHQNNKKKVIQKSYALWQIVARCALS